MCRRFDPAPHHEGTLANAGVFLFGLGTGRLRRFARNDESPSEIAEGIVIVFSHGELRLLCFARNDIVRKDYFFRFDLVCLSLGMVMASFNVFETISRLLNCFMTIFF